MNKKPLTVSVVIPAYNEAAMIGACLDALQRQTVPPDEIIVVDNNSTDETVAIVRRLYPQVKVLHESQQGIIFARNRGFNAARGDIIARMDADTQVPPGWVARLREVFIDEKVAAVVGQDWYYDRPCQRLVRWCDVAVRRIYIWMVRGAMLHGCNMAMRRQAWEQASPCVRKDIHEDSDLAIHLRQRNLKIRYDPLLLAGVSARRLSTPWPSFKAYLRRMLTTYSRHGRADLPGVVFFCAVMITAYGVNGLYGLGVARAQWQERYVYRPME